MSYASHAEVMARQAEIAANFSLDGWGESVRLPDLRTDEEKAQAEKCVMCDGSIMIGTMFCQIHRAEDFLVEIGRAFDPW